MRRCWSLDETPVISRVSPSTWTFTVRPVVSSEPGLHRVDHRLEHTGGLRQSDHEGSDPDCLHSLGSRRDLGHFDGLDRLDVQLE
jgi:hypothetical protein